MPKLSPDSVPSYRLHKQSGQAIVTLSGRDFLLGAHGTPESHQEYRRRVGEWLANGRQLPEQRADMTVGMLVNLFRQHAEKYYRHADGTPSGELDNFYQVLSPLRKLYGSTPAAEFGPLKLKGFRDVMMRPRKVTNPETGGEETRAGWCRNVLNRQIARVKMMFQWASENELVPPTVYHGLLSVKGLRTGRSDARETSKVLPVPQPILEATLPHLSRHIRAMVDVQLLTAMRPGELCAMRVRDLDMSGDVWLYHPPIHKTAHHDFVRDIAIGPKAQDVIRPFLGTDLEAHIFRPADAITERRESAAAKRKTPLNQGNRAGTRQKKDPKRRPGTRYTVASYRRAIARACEAADVWAKGGLIIGNDETLIPAWHPHQLSTLR